MRDSKKILVLGAIFAMSLIGCGATNNDSCCEGEEQQLSNGGKLIQKIIPSENNTTRSMQCNIDINTQEIDGDLVFTPILTNCKEPQTIIWNVHKVCCHVIDETLEHDYLYLNLDILKSYDINTTFVFNDQNITINIKEEL